MAAPERLDGIVPHAEGGGTQRPGRHCTMIDRGRGRGILGEPGRQPGGNSGSEELEMPPSKKQKQECQSPDITLGNVEKQSASNDIDPAAVQLAFRIHRPNLLGAINCTLQVTNFLYSKGVLSEAARNKLSPDVMGLSKDERNMILLNEVEDKIKSDPQVFQTFIDALRSEPALEVQATQLLEVYREYKTSGVPVGAPALHAGPVARYASYLKAYYNTSPISQDYKWPLTPSTKFINLAVIKKKCFNRAEADAFTRATLHGDIDQILKHKEPITMENILKPYRKQRPRFVLVEGPPGVGKSTFAWELCRKWDEIELLKQFSLVVLVRLRDVAVQKAKTVADLLYHEDSCLQQAVVQEVRQSEGDGVLLVLDGADEYPASLRVDRRSLFFMIVSGFCLPRATVLVTSRPSASRELAHELKPHKHVEILGFTKEQIAQYAESVFESDPDLLTGFKKYISSSPSIRSILYIPLNNAIVTGVYRENAAKDKPIPTTLTQLYDDLSCILLQRYMLHVKPVESLLPEVFEEFPQQIRESLLALAKAAYEGILEQRLIFSRFPEGTTVLGFTTTSPELHTGKKLSHSFLHLTLQEYLAAVYISHLPPEEQKEIFREHDSQQHLEVVWRFVAGMTGFVGIGWDLVKSMKTKHNQYGASIGEVFLVQCLYEAQCKADCEAILGPQEVTHRVEPHTPIDCYSLGYCIAHSKCTWDVQLNHTVAVAMLETFAFGMYCQHEICSHIQMLEFTRSPFDKMVSPLGEEGVACLRGLPLKRIRCLKLDDCGLDAAAFGLLALIVPEMCSLKLLDVCDNLVTSGGTLELLRALVKVKSLQILNMVGLNLGTSDNREALGELIAPSTGTLKELEIGRINIITVEKLVKTVFKQSSLQTLEIAHTDLQSSMSTLAALLEDNSNLKSLELYVCRTGGVSGAKCLAASLCKNTTLEELRVYTDCNEDSLDGEMTSYVWSLEMVEIGDKGAIAFSEMLKVNQSLRTLALVSDHTGIGDEGKAALIDSLNYNQTLEKLRLYKDRDDTSTEHVHPRVEWDPNNYG